LLPIFASEREKKDDEFSYDDFLESFRRNGKNAVFLKDKDFMVEYIDRNFQSDNFVVMTMGAGDVYKAASNLLASSI